MREQRQARVTSLALGAVAGGGSKPSRSFGVGPLTRSCVRSVCSRSGVGMGVHGCGAEY